MELKQDQKCTRNWMRIRRLAKNPGVKPVGVGRRALGAPEPQSLPDRGAGRRGGLLLLFLLFLVFICDSCENRWFWSNTYLSWWEPGDCLPVWHQFQYGCVHHIDANSSLAVETIECDWIPNLTKIGPSIKRWMGWTVTVKRRRRRRKNGIQSGAKQWQG